MAIRCFSINFDREVYSPGETVSGRVYLSVNMPIKLRAVELSLSGKAEWKWWKGRLDRTPENEKLAYNGKETFFEETLILAGGRKFILYAGEFVYPFSVTIPDSLPATFRGKYGGIKYGGKAKLNLVWLADEFAKKHFFLESPINLNTMPISNKPYRDYKVLAFCSWRYPKQTEIRSKVDATAVDYMQMLHARILSECKGIPVLTVTVLIPLTGFVPNECIPITIDVQNASNVRVNSINIELLQTINWKAKRSSANEKILIKKHIMTESVGSKASKTWTEEFHLEPGEYANSGNCHVIQIGYELKIEFDAKGLRRNLVLSTPITIGSSNENIMQPINTFSYMPGARPWTVSAETHRLPLVSLHRRT